MNRFVIMTVGKTHSGKTTFAKQLESEFQQAIVIDQDNHAEFINLHYKKLLPPSGPNTLKFSVTNAIVQYAVENSDFHIILSNANLYKRGRQNVLQYFHEHGFNSIIVYFNLPHELLQERVNSTQRGKSIFRSASSFQEVLSRQEQLPELEPSTDEATHFYTINDPSIVSDTIHQIKELIVNSRKK